MKNYLLAFALSLGYFLACFLKQDYPFYFLIAVPVFFGILSCIVIKGKRIAKRGLATVVPIFSLPWIYLFLNIQDFIGVVLLHSFLIGLLVVQLWEAIEWIFEPIKKKFKIT